MYLESRFINFLGIFSCSFRLNLPCHCLPRFIYLSVLSIFLSAFILAKLINAEPINLYFKKLTLRHHFNRNPKSTIWLNRIKKVEKNAFFLMFRVFQLSSINYNCIFKILFYHFVHLLIVSYCKILIFIFFMFVFVEFLFTGITK